MANKESDYHTARGIPMLMTVEEVAAALRKSKWAVYRLIRAGELVASKVGDSWRISASAVEAFLSATSNQ